jgi:zinc D-Ala-D-Ala carboxypeptidase
MDDQKLTHSFMLSEFIASDTADRRGIDNAPTPAALANIKGVLAPGMQRIRDALRKPVLISSGYRCQMLNAIVNGSPNSAHVNGLAADFRSPGFGTPNAVVRFLLKQAEEIGFDQMIFEGSWVHVAFAAQGKKPRYQVLTARFDANGRASYSEGLA